ncbi:hypothetical protein [Klebsiella pneumoniae]|uniref:hypothetical protein n=1 Tax=Klebsiella pneumoniae TaxID=573 RepID=UPI000D4BCC18|nr:hypothetical protein [Klebsiella pneumoniae]QKE17733.1 hypothetical protein C5707_028975 [Klebsiella pneumoniae]
MKKALITTVALAVAALSGCASTSSYEPTAYKTNHSRAYNIAEAGGLVTGILLWSNLNGHFDRVFSPRQGT